MNPAAGDPADRFDILAVAASAGGVHALSTFLGALPEDFPVPVLVVQHLDARHETILADILDRRSPLLVKLAEAGELAKGGTVYVAPPNYHLVVGQDGVLWLSGSERTQFVRPSADVLFESVAEAYGPRAIVCVLTGTGRDGAVGVAAVRERGGTVIAEDPETAEFSGMPSAAVHTGKVDRVLPLTEIPTAIRDLLVATQP
jgi:two-component system chemotaxis response regulator CheB